MAGFLLFYAPIPLQNRVFPGAVLEGFCRRNLLGRVSDAPMQGERTVAPESVFNHVGRKSPAARLLPGTVSFRKKIPSGSIAPPEGIVVRDFRLSVKRIV